MTTEQIAIDTNILVRILIDDPGQLEQVNLARQSFTNNPSNAFNSAEQI